ncbi:TPA: hypothetical protein ACN976_004185 [Vibrio campbellii]
MMIKRKMGYFRAVNFFQIAIDACDRTHAQPEQALVCLIFASNALEAFINETVACYEVTAGGQFTEREKSFFTVMSEQQKNKGSILSKFELGKLILSGAGWDRDKAPYQDLKLMLKVRNELVHRKAEVHKDILVSGVGFPEKTLNSHPKFFDELSSKGLCDVSAIDGSWIDMIQNHTFASWCCETAKKITTEFLNSVDDAPNSNFKSKLQEKLDFEPILST